MTIALVSIDWGGEWLVAFWIFIVEEKRGPVSRQYAFQLDRYLGLIPHLVKLRKPLTLV
ncbi:hypothetical protein D9M68_326030 [compost metagenome]